MHVASPSTCHTVTKPKKICFIDVNDVIRYECVDFCTNSGSNTFSVNGFNFLRRTFIRLFIFKICFFISLDNWLLTKCTVAFMATFVCIIQ